MTPEGRVVAALKKRAKMDGLLVRKCSWIGHVGAPDLFFMDPRTGVHFWVEVKAPGQAPRLHQDLEMERMREAGCSVFVLDDAEQLPGVIRLASGQKTRDLMNRGS